MSLNSILSTAASGLRAHQRMVETASHNIANAATEGFSRQRVRLDAAPPLRTPNGLVGRGVLDSGVERTRDTFLDAQLRAENGALGYQKRTAAALTQVEGLLGELGEAGLGTQLDDFFNAWNDLASDPVSVATRSSARQASLHLAYAFRVISSRLTQVGADAQGKLQPGVDEINRLAASIAELNIDIVANSANGGAPDLEDRRDLALDRLSQLVQVQAIREPDNSMTLVAGGFVLADRSRSITLELKIVGVGYGAGFVGAPNPIDFRSGEVKALADFTQRTIPSIIGQLDQLAASVVARVNAIYTAGQTTGGVGGVPIFDPAGTTAATMAVSAPLEADLANLVTGTTAAPGDATIALQIARLRTENQSTLGDRAFGEFTSSIAFGVGQGVRNAEDAVTAQEALVGQIAAKRSSVQDVSIDEEMVSLLKSQQSYAAAAKVITTADQMMQAILQMV